MRQAHPGHRRWCYRGSTYPMRHPYGQQLRGLRLPGERSPAISPRTRPRDGRPRWVNAAETGDAASTTATGSFSTR